MAHLNGRWIVLAAGLCLFFSASESVMTEDVWTVCSAGLSAGMLFHAW